MIASTPADKLKRLHERLDWAVHLVSLQPGDVQEAYQRVGQAIADALVMPVYSFQILLPERLLIDSALQPVPKRWRPIRVGNFLTRMRKVSLNADLINALNNLAANADPVVGSAAQLAAYTAARHILVAHLPSIARITGDFAAFDDHGERLALSDTKADATIRHLCQYVEWLHVVERLYPGWTASDPYNEIYSTITGQLTEQGRALAHYYTVRLIDELMARWRRGEIARGLTLFIPYLDEQRYQMDTYKVVVVPNARIPFRPQFVVSACRVAQREVRLNPRLSQATRWQLISHLDQLIHAFEIRTESTSREAAHDRQPS